MGEGGRSAAFHDFGRCSCQGCLQHIQDAGLLGPVCVYMSCILWSPWFKARNPRIDVHFWFGERGAWPFDARWSERRSHGREVTRAQPVPHCGWKDGMRATSEHIFGIARYNAEHPIVPKSTCAYGSSQNVVKPGSFTSIQVIISTVRSGGYPKVCLCCMHLCWW